MEMPLLQEILHKATLRRIRALTPGMPYHEALVLEGCSLAKRLSAPTEGLEAFLLRARIRKAERELMSLSEQGL